LNNNKATLFSLWATKSPVQTAYRGFAPGPHGRGGGSRPPDPLTAYHHVPSRFRLGPQAPLATLVASGACSAPLWNLSPFFCKSGRSESFQVCCHGTQNEDNSHGVSRECFCRGAIHHRPPTADTRPGLCDFWALRLYPV